MGALEFKASQFAVIKHRAIDHRRKYTNEPYELHLAEVANLVAFVPHTEEMLAAAWLHDVVEDCGVTFKELCQKFGPQVTSLVMMMTDVSKLSDGNRKVRKQMDLEHTRDSLPEGKTIKLADLISNSRSIIGLDHPEAKAFAKVWIPEKRALMEVLKEGDPTLYQIAMDLVK